MRAWSLEPGSPGSHPDSHPSLRLRFCPVHEDGCPGLSESRGLVLRGTRSEYVRYMPASHSGGARPAVLPCAGGAPSGFHPSSSIYCSSSGSDPVASRPQSACSRFTFLSTGAMFSLPQSLSIFSSAVGNTFLRPNAKRLCYFTALRFLRGTSRPFARWAHRAGP